MIDAGDIVHVDFNPVRGSEQGGARPALVLTDKEFHDNRSTAIVCPITSNMSEWPTKIPLPDGFPIEGAILTEQIRLVSRETRGFRKLGAVPPETLSAVRTMLADILHLFPDTTSN